MTKEYDGKLYRVIKKTDSHINTKLNPDGSKSAIQFTNEGNELSGPLDIIEVDEYELTKAVSIDNKPRTLREIVIEEVLVPAAQEVLYNAFIIGYEKICYQLKTNAIPKIKRKSTDLFKNTKIIASGIKAAVAGEKPKVLQIMKKYNTESENIIAAHNEEYQEHETVIRTEEEVIDIINAMKISAITLVACIRMLNKTVISDDGSDVNVRLEIQNNIQTLTASDVISQIELLLEEKNKGLLDDESRSILLAFSEGYFIIDDKKVPIALYKDSTISEQTL